MNFLYYAVIAVHIFTCLFLIGVVLLQQGKGQDLASAFGGGGTQTAFGPRGSANVLSRATTILAGVFMVTSLALTILRPHERSVFDTGAGQPASAPASAPATPGASVPASTAPASPSSTAPAASPAASPKG